MEHLNIFLRILGLQRTLIYKVSSQISLNSLWLVWLFFCCYLCQNWRLVVSIVSYFIILVCCSSVCYSSFQNTFLIGCIFCHRMDCKRTSCWGHCWVLHRGFFGWQIWSNKNVSARFDSSYYWVLSLVCMAFPVLLYSVLFGFSWGHFFWVNLVKEKIFGQCYCTGCAHNDNWPSACWNRNWYFLRYCSAVHIRGSNENYCSYFLFFSVFPRLTFWLFRYRQLRYAGLLDLWTSFLYASAFLALWWPDSLWQEILFGTCFSRFKYNSVQYHFWSLNHIFWCNFQMYVFISFCEWIYIRNWSQ